MSWVKYLVTITFFIGVMVFVSLVSIKHQSNIASTQDVSLDLSTVNVGDARLSMNGNMDKEALISNLLLKIASSQKSHEHNTEISYVFLDGDGRITNNNNNIKSVQFEVKLYNKNGQVQSISTERIEINSLLGG